MGWKYFSLFAITPGEFIIQIKEKQESLQQKSYRDAD